MTPTPNQPKLPGRIIYTHGGGRLGNQLIAHSHLLGFWKEHEGALSLINTAMWHYEDLFEEEITARPSASVPAFIRVIHWLHRPIATSRLRRRSKMVIYLGGVAVTYLLARVFPGWDALTVRDHMNVTNHIGRQAAHVDLDSVADTSAAFGSPNTLLLAGYGLRSWELVEKHQAFIRHHLRPKASITTRAAERLATLRNQTQTLIGIQIRHSDYRVWRDGRFYYSLDLYLAWLGILAERFSGEGSVGFVICSDVSHPRAAFSQIKNPLFLAWEDESSALQPMFDIALLSSCDLIVAPPSTFAFWAAFLGQRRVLCLVDQTIDVGTAALLQNSIFDAARDPIMSLAVS